MEKYRLGSGGVLMAAVLLSATAQGEETRGREAPKTTPKKVETETGAGGPTAPDVVKTTEGAEEGVKTYEFGTVEVEGRLRSPQIIYFLRRVRAEFETDALGHRSFLLELRDTRRNPAFR